MSAAIARRATRSLRFERAADVPGYLWPCARTFLDPSYLRTLDETLGSQMDVRYAVLTKSDEPVAGAVFQRVDFDPDQAFPSLAGSSTTWMASMARRLRISGVICGNTFASGPHGYWAKPGLASAELAGWLTETLEHFRTELAPPGRRTLAVIKDVPDAPDSARHLGSRFRSYVENPAMTLELAPRWRSLRCYAGDLRKSYRRELRLARKRLHGIDRRPLGPREIAVFDERMNQLRDQVLGNATAVPARKDARCLALLVERLAGRCSVVGYFKRGELLAFNTRFSDGQDYESHYFGMDYRANREHALYRNMLYDDIAHAIAGGFRRIHFGRCSHESKSAMGARPVSWSSFVSHPSRMLSKLVVSAAHKLGRASWTERHPFKADTMGNRPPPDLETRVV